MIRFSCACGHAFEVQPAYAGREGPCPQCGRHVVIPTGGRQATKQFPGTIAPPVGLGGGSPAAQVRPGARLEVVHGPAAARGQSYPLPADRSVTLGRDPTADLSVPSERISRHHCRFVPGPGGALAVEDLGSSNGTRVNQAPIQGLRALVSGDYVQTGDCLFRVVL